MVFVSVHIFNLFHSLIENLDTMVIVEFDNLVTTSFDIETSQNDLSHGSGELHRLMGELQCKLVGKVSSDTFQAEPMTEQDGMVSRVSEVHLGLYKKNLMRYGDY